jgi:hypothetical protein
MSDNILSNEESNLEQEGNIAISILYTYMHVLVNAKIIANRPSICHASVFTSLITSCSKQEGKFTFEFMSNDLGGYKSGDWRYDVSVVKQ